MECPSHEACDHVDYSQFTLDFELDAGSIDWDDIPELDIAPEASKSLSSTGERGASQFESREKEIELATQVNKLNDKKSSRIMNEFLKKYAAKLLKYSIIAILMLYLIDTLLMMSGMANSTFADPLFTLLQTIITTVIGYLIGSNQSKE